MTPRNNKDFSDGWFTGNMKDSEEPFRDVSIDDWEAVKASQKQRSKEVHEGK